MMKTNRVGALTRKYGFDGKNVLLTWLPGESYQGLKPIKQAYGFCFNREGKLLVQQKKPGPWQVMGGTIEPGETPEETLIREVDEEVNIEIADIHYLGAQKVEEPDREAYYQLRFAARITKLKERQADPDKGILRKRRFINPNDYAKVSDWGEIGTAIVKRAKLKLNIK
jgi:8-oxo-dGTP diphosphatase